MFVDVHSSPIHSHPVVETSQTSPSTDDSTNKCPHERILSHHKMNEALTHAMTRTNLENILPRERSQTPQSTRFRFCFYEVSGIGESCRARKGRSGYQGLVEGRMGNGSLMGEVFFVRFFFFF